MTIRITLADPFHFFCVSLLLCSVPIVLSVMFYLLYLMHVSKTHFKQYRENWSGISEFIVSNNQTRKLHIKDGKYFQNWSRYLSPK